jgi:hypothetical protein
MFDFTKQNSPFGNFELWALDLIYAFALYEREGGP